MYSSWLIWQHHHHHHLLTQAWILMHYRNQTHPLVAVVQLRSCSWLIHLSLSLSLSLSIPRSGFPKQKRNSSWILLQREPPPKPWSPERSHRCTFLLAAPQFFFHLFFFFFFFFPKSDQICVLSLSHSSSSSSSVGFFFLAQVFLPLLILPWSQWGCFAFAIPLFCVLPSVSLPLSNGVFLHFSQKKNLTLQGPI